MSVTSLLTEALARVAELEREQKTAYESLKAFDNYSSGDLSVCIREILRVVSADLPQAIQRETERAERAEAKLAELERERAEREWFEHTLVTIATSDGFGSASDMSNYARIVVKAVQDKRATSRDGHDGQKCSECGLVDEHKLQCSRQEHRQVVLPASRDVENKP